MTDDGPRAGEGDGGGRAHEMVDLDVRRSLWTRFYTVNPLVVVGTREGDGYDLAPKHMAFPLGWEGFFGFVCTPRHSTYHNARAAGAFTVSYPGPDQVVQASLAAQPREGRPSWKPGLETLPTEPAREVEGILLADAYLQLECELERVVDGFGASSLVVGRVAAARVRREALRSSEQNDYEVVRHTPLLAYLHPNRYGEVADSEAFPFPADFQR